MEGTGLSLLIRLLYRRAPPKSFTPGRNLTSVQAALAWSQTFPVSGFSSCFKGSESPGLGQLWRRGRRLMRQMETLVFFRLNGSAEGCRL